ncbi:MAG TPA: glycosyltransferase [Nitrosopumilaceae archaeon]|nr:glycosyltransferase [Nitrosopumilaceae archaeon]
MLKIGEFIYPWGNGHYTRMMALDQILPKYIKSEFEVHYSSKGEIYQKLLKRFPTKKHHIHEIFMPTPIDGKKGPSVTRSLWNFLLPVSGNPPLVKQISSYLIKEAKLYDSQKFDLVINDGDVGSNVLAEKRGINCIFVTNQFKPKLWKSHSYFYPSVVYISKQIEKATKIIVADSAPPNTICEYNLNFTDKIKEKVIYVGHFSNKIITNPKPKSDLEKLIENEDFGYWMRTGNKATNDVTGKKYKQVFRANDMRNEKRIISHAKNDPTIDRVTGKDGKVYSFSEAFNKKTDWIQIDVGFLSEHEKNTVLDLCKYAVINGSHTAMGEILGIKAKPIIGIPIYDEHTNQIKWAEDRHLGVLATNKKQVIIGIHKIRKNYEEYLEHVTEFARGFDSNGAQNTAEIISKMLES